MASLTRFVQTMTSMYSTAKLVRAGKATASQVVGEIVFAPDHFPKFLTVTMMLSGLTGYFTMEYIQQTRWEVSCFKIRAAFLVSVTEFRCLGRITFF
jgi:predicted nuclease of restriction endonuclease-like RecB superfamily